MLRTRLLWASRSSYPCTGDANTMASDFSTGARERRVSQGLTRQKRVKISNANGIAEGAESPSCTKCCPQACCAAPSRRHRPARCTALAARRDQPCTAYRTPVNLCKLQASCNLLSRRCPSGRGPRPAQPYEAGAAASTSSQRALSPCLLPIANDGEHPACPEPRPTCRLPPPTCRGFTRCGAQRTSTGAQ